MPRVALVTVPLGLVPLLALSSVPPSPRVLAPDLTDPPPPHHDDIRHRRHKNENPHHHPQHRHPANLGPTHHPWPPVIMKLVSSHSACRDANFMITGSGGAAEPGVGGCPVGPAAPTSLVSGTEGVPAERRDHEVHDHDVRLAAGLRRDGRARPATSRPGRPEEFAAMRRVHGEVQQGPGGVRGVRRRPGPGRAGARPAGAAAGRRAGRDRRPVRRRPRRCWPATRSSSATSFDRATEIAARLANCPARTRVADDGYVDVRPIARGSPSDLETDAVTDDRASRTCCAGWRRRSSARWSAATGTSTPPRTRCRRRCSRPPRSGRATACRTTRGPG